MSTENLSTLHDIAMDLADEAKKLANTGNQLLAQRIYNKAFFLEKTFALAFPLDDDEFQLSRSVFLNSAANLALAAGKNEEAKALAERALQNKPHPAFEEELHSIINKSTEKSTSSTTVHITGTIVSADLLSNQIKVQDQQDQQVYIFDIKEIDLVELVKSYWATQVQIEAKFNNGFVLLNSIKKAA